MQSYKFISSCKKNVKLVILNFWGNTNHVKIPIINPKNWSTLVHDMLQRSLFEIDIDVIQVGELRERKERMKENFVEFDSDGSI